VGREVAVVQASNWPSQCSPLSTVFDLIKLVDEESLRATGGRRDRPILVLDRYCIVNKYVTAIKVDMLKIFYVIKLLLIRQKMQTFRFSS
jgi:hypothetical protein